jgi:hypothetical protein
MSIHRFCAKEMLHYAKANPSVQEEVVKSVNKGPGLWRRIFPTIALCSVVTLQGCYSDDDREGNSNKEQHGIHINGGLTSKMYSLHAVPGPLPIAGLLGFCFMVSKLRDSAIKGQ